MPARAEGTKPAHPATVSRKREAPVKEARPAHPATVSRKREAPVKEARPPHPAAVGKGTVKAPSPREAKRGVGPAMPVAAQVAEVLKGSALRYVVQGKAAAGRGAPADIEVAVSSVPEAEAALVKTGEFAARKGARAGARRVVHRASGASVDLVSG